MDLIQSMRVFSRIADTESFTRAAEQMDLSVPAVVRSIANLEAHLKVRLLNRTTRHVALSDAGQAYLEGCRAVLDQLEDAETNVTRAQRETQGALRVAVGSVFAQQILIPVLVAYRRAYPNIQLNLTLVDREIDLVDEGYDAAVVSDTLLRSETLVMRPLVEFNNVPIASRAYLKQVAAPQRPSDLAQLAYLGRSGEARGYTVTFTGPDATEQVELKPIFTANNALVLKQMVQADMGFALIPPVLAGEDLRNGRLVQLIPGSTVADAGARICLAYASRKHISCKMRTFIDHMTQSFASGIPAQLQAIA
jgi:DNA-binding transcriptional LysR family regulator